MRVAILGERMYDGDNATFSALSKVPGTRLFACFPRPNTDVPIDMKMFSWLEDQYVFTPYRSSNRLAHYFNSGDLDVAVLEQKLRAFAPEAFLVASWHVPAYRKVLRKFPDALKIVRFDNQWSGSWRQRLGAMFARYYIHNLFDVAFVGGERQAQLARMLGFADGRIWQGAFTCNHDRYGRIYHQAKDRPGPMPRSFLYVGLLSPRKGAHLLAEAYQLYRSRTDDPWPLTICGLGDLYDEVKDQAGVDMRGFVQPTDLPAIYGESACLVSPSTFEAWGYVLHEATAAGLPVICTAAAGAGVHLVRDYFNGFVVQPGDVEGLANALCRFAALSDERRRLMGDNSHRLSLQFTPALWAEQFHARSMELLDRKRLSRFGHGSGTWPEGASGA